MEYCFHHIPKTAGSSLQLRLSHREFIGQLPKGSTLIVYPLYQELRYYRVSEDKNFNKNESIKKAFLRTYKQKNEGDASIVMGHYTNITQPGKHYTWLRHPLHRDISHFNYDSKYEHNLDNDFSTHLAMMSGNFMVQWLYGRYLGQKELLPIEVKYQRARAVLKEKFETGSIIIPSAFIAKTDCPILLIRSSILSKETLNSCVLILTFFSRCALSSATKEACVKASCCNWLIKSASPSEKNII